MAVTKGTTHGLTNAQTTEVQSGAQLRADALTQGDGGTVVVWADGATRYAGAISAQGGSAGGNGGIAEVSGKQYLDFQGLVDLRAVQGEKGSLLLDPLNIVVGGCDDITGGNGGLCGYGDIVLGGDLSNSASYAGATSYITASTVGTLLDATDVTLAATNNITISTAINKSETATAVTSLSMNAGNDILFSGTGTDILSSGAALNVTLTAGRDISNSGTLQAQGGVVKLSAGRDLTMNGNIVTTGAVVVSATGNLSGYSYSLGDAYNNASSVSVSSAGASTNLPKIYTNGSASVTMTGTGSYVFDGSRFGSASSISLATPNGSISASQNFNGVAQLTATAANGIDISSSSISAFQATNTGSGNISFTTNSAPVTISGLSAANGNITVSNTGGSRQRERLRLPMVRSVSPPIVRSPLAPTALQLAARLR